MSSLSDSLKEELKRKARFKTPMDVIKHNNPEARTAPVNEFISDIFVKAVMEPDKRIIINIGSQIGKSTTTTVNGVAWALHQNPKTRVILGSYKEDLSAGFGQQIKDALEGIGVPISKSSSSKSDFNLANGVGRVYCTGVGGGTGIPADLIVLDDVVKGAKEASSQMLRDETWDWYTTVILGRLGKGASVINVMTRWHWDDLCGRLIREQGIKGEIMPDGSEGIWEVYNIPARCVDPENDLFGRELGEYLENVRGWDEQDWKNKEKAMGARAFEAIYQGNPIPEGGTLFKTENIETFKHTLLDYLHEEGEWLSSWDLASSKNKGSDYSVGQVWVRAAGRLYLVDQVRGQWGFGETVRMFEYIKAKWPRCTRHVVENKSNGPAFIDKIKESGVTGVISFNPNTYGNKYARADMASPAVESKDVWILSDKWNGDFLGEMATFPNGRNDDCVDAFSQAKIYFDNELGGGRSPWITYGLE